MKTSTIATEKYMPRRKSARLKPPMPPTPQPPTDDDAVLTVVSPLQHAAALTQSDQTTTPPASPALSSSSSMGSDASSSTSSSMRLDGSPSRGGRANPHLHIKRLTRDSRTISERKLFTPTADKLVLVMVGLPARGKSFIAKKLWKFLCWKGLKCEVFNVGQLRRTLCEGTQDHTFFDPNNTRAKEERELLAMQSLQQVQDWLKGSGGSKGGDIAIFDATNTTKSRRQALLDAFDGFSTTNNMSVRVVFVESICTNEAVINANITQKVTSSPDYRTMSVEEAIEDLKQRMKNYEAAYEALEDEEGISYIKLFDLQSKVHAKGMYVAPCSFCSCVCVLEE